MKCISHSTKKRTNPKTAIPSRARSSSAIPRPGPLRPLPRTALPPEDRVGARRGGAGGERKVGRGRGGVGWGRKGRAGPARPRPRAVLGALATAGAAVAALSGLGGRGSAFPFASPHRRGRQPDPARPRPAAPPPRRGAPRRVAHFPAPPPPQLRALIETGGLRPDSPARPAPAGPRPPPLRSRPRSLRLLRRPPSRCVTVARPWEAPLAGRPPGSKPGPPCSAAAYLSASGRGARGGQHCSPSGSGGGA